MKKKEAKELLIFGEECPECINGKMKVVEGFINIGNWFLRCQECGFEYDN